MINIILRIPSQYILFSAKKTSLINSFIHLGAYCDRMQYKYMLNIIMCMLSQYTPFL